MKNFLYISTIRLRDMKDTKLNLNPKRLITFERKYSEYLKQEIRNAKKSGEDDYVVWLNNRLQWSETILQKKIDGLTKQLRHAS